MAADESANITVKVSYTDGQNFSELITSTNTVAVDVFDNGVAPATITGNAQVGQVLTANLGADPDGGPLTAVSYTWLRTFGGLTTPVQTSATNTYTLVAADQGATISVRVNYTDGQSFLDVTTSASTGAVAAAGTNTITGTAVADALTGTAGVDLINAGGGGDTITALGGNDTVNGDGGNDRFVATVNDGNDVFDGGAGTDTFDLSGTNGGVNVTILAVGNISVDGPQTGTDTLANVEAIIGSLGNDTYTVNRTGVTLTESSAVGGTDAVISSVSWTLGANFETLTLTGSAAINGTGSGGDNVITGNSANNAINGGGGNDVLKAMLVGGGTDGNDGYTGGAGTDTYDISATSAGARINLTAGSVTVSGVAIAANSATSAQIGTDTLNTIENVVGSSGADTIVAGTVLNQFMGGAGSDQFVFVSAASAGNGATADVIADWSTGDTINLSFIDADTRTGGTQTFVFDTVAKTAANNTVAASHIGYIYDAATNTTIIEANIRTQNNNDVTQDFQIKLLGDQTAHLSFNAAQGILSFV